jgi:hypothetical protein
MKAYGGRIERRMKAARAKQALGGDAPEERRRERRPEYN